MRRVYISGPMTGCPVLNHAAFNAEAARLRGMGFDVVNPADLVADEGTAWADYMRADIRLLLTCDAVALLPGWDESRGAQLEVEIARSLGMTVRLASDVGCEVTYAGPWRQALVPLEVAA